MTTHSPAIEAFAEVPLSFLERLERFTDNFENGEEGHKLNRQLQTIIAAAREMRDKAETHVWVPKEPTLEIVRAGEEADMNEHGPLVSRKQAAMLYRAMISAKEPT